MPTNLMSLISWSTNGLLVEVQNLKRSLATGTTMDKQGLIEALRSWLLVHIQTADKTLAEYLSTRADRPASQEP